jgi:hypothetical protein
MRGPTCLHRSHAPREHQCGSDHKGVVALPDRYRDRRAAGSPVRGPTTWTAARPESVPGQMQAWLNGRSDRIWQWKIDANVLRWRPLDQPGSRECGLKCSGTPRSTRHPRDAVHKTVVSWLPVGAPNEHSSRAQARYPVGRCVEIEQTVHCQPRQFLPRPVEC